MLFHLDRVAVEEVAVVNGKVVISAAACATTVACPDCAAVSSRVHGCYRRRLADIALAGWPVVLNLRVRRFVCATPDCRRRTFVEQVEGLTSRLIRHDVSGQLHDGKFTRPAVDFPNRCELGSGS
ncbi:transposase family protein, partial [Micromonospora rubida]